MLALRSRHRVKLNDQPPPTWYKDEGGKDKCIALNGLLVDENEEVVKR